MNTSKRTVYLTQALNQIRQAIDKQQSIRKLMLRTGDLSRELYSMPITMLAKDKEEVELIDYITRRFHGKCKCMTFDKAVQTNPTCSVLSYDLQIDNACELMKLLSDTHMIIDEYAQVVINLQQLDVIEAWLRMPWYKRIWHALFADKLMPAVQAIKKALCYTSN